MLAIIGGTGLYALDAMQVTERIDAQTPFGAASGPISKGRLGNHEVLFLARHGDDPAAVERPDVGPRDADPGA